MKKSNLCLIAALVLGAGYSGLWMVQASRFEKRLLQHISQMIEKTPFDMHFECESMKKSGFPFDIKIALQNPKLEIAREEITKEALGSTANKRERVLDCALDGTITDTFTLFGRIKKVEAEGRALITLTKNEFAPAAQWNAKGGVAIDFEPPYSILDTLSNFFDDNIQEVRACTVTCGEGTLTNLASKSDLEGIKIKQGVVHYEKNSTSNLLHVASELSVSQNLSIEIPDLTGDIKVIADAVNSELRNKIFATEYAIDFQVEIPLFKTIKAIANSASLLLSEPIPRVAFEIKKFETKNEFSKSSLAASLSVEEDGNKNVRARALVDSKAEYQEAATQIVLQVLDALKAKSAELQAQDGDMKKLKGLIHDHMDAVKALVPKLSSFGPITFAKSVAFDANKETFRAQVQLEKLALLCSLYGASLTGKVAYEAGSIKGESTAEISTYKQLIRDIVDYYNRVTVVLNYLKNESTPDYKTISKTLSDKIIGYLQAISDHPQLESQSVKITFGNKDGAGKIGTMSLPEFVAYSTKTIGEIGDELFPKPAPVQVVPATEPAK